MHWIAPSEKDSANGTLEKRLWDAADQFRANSGLKAQEYSSPVLGLIFLRFADVRFAAVRARLDAGGVSSRRASRVDDATAYHAEGVLFLSPEARFEHLLSLPEGADVGKAINDAMRDIEKHNPQLAGVLPKTYNLFTSTLLKELLKKVSEIPATVDYDTFGRIYEYFLGEFARTEGQKGGEFYTPSCIVRLLTEIIEPYHGRILDPACGSGGSLPASTLCGSALRGKGSRYRAWRCAVGKIRRIENDMLEAVVGLPDQLFYNTGISTYVWIVTNRKRKERRGKVQLINGTDFAWKMKKSLGDKRKRIGDGTDGAPNHIEVLAKLYGDFAHDVRQTVGEIRTNVDPTRDQTKSLFVSKIFDNQDFGYLKITVERPLRLNFAVTDERIDRFKRTSAFVELALSRKRKDKKKIIEEEMEGAEAQAAILEVLDGMKGPFAAGHIVKDRAIFDQQLSDAFAAADITLDACPVARSSPRAAWASAIPRRKSAATRKATPSPTPNCATPRTSRSRPAPSCRCHSTTRARRTRARWTWNRC